jgi:thymidylate synthase (FAD)
MSNQIGDRIDIQNLGSITVLAHTNMDGDLLAVNAARASFSKRSESFTEKDHKLLMRLIKDNHRSVFYHFYASFSIEAPISVHRQWERHRIGTALNSESTRYVDKVDEDVYIPETFRLQSQDNKQGSAGVLSDDEQDMARATYVDAVSHAWKSYNTLLKMGVAREQARDVLPLGTKTKFVWTASTEAIIHFLELRLDSHAQWEIRQYAKALSELVSPMFPSTLYAKVSAHE